MLNSQQIITKFTKNNTHSKDSCFNCLDYSNNESANFQQRYHCTAKFNRKYKFSSIKIGDHHKSISERNISRPIFFLIRNCTSVVKVGWEVLRNTSRCTSWIIERQVKLENTRSGNLPLLRE